MLLTLTGAVACATALSGCSPAIVDNYYKIRCWERNVCEGDEAFRKQDFPASVHEYDLALAYADNKPREIATKLRLATALTYAGDCARAEPLLSALRATYDASGDRMHALEVLMLLGDCCLQGKRLPEAKEYFQHALADARKLESDGTWSVRATKTQKTSLLALSTIALEENDATASSDYEQQAEDLRVRKASQIGVVELDRALEAASVASDRDEHRKVIRILEPFASKAELRQNTASYQHMMMALSKAYQHTDQVDKSIEAFKQWLQVVEDDPYHKDADVFRIYARYGHALVKEERYQDALEILERGKKKMPAKIQKESAELMVDMTNAYRHLLKVKEARHFLAEAKRLNAVMRDPRVDDNIAGEELKLGRLEKTNQVVAH